jgi:hypothetical protein
MAEFRCSVVVKNSGSDNMSEQTTTINVGFNQQQRQLIERLKAEGAFGESEGEIIRSIFINWLGEEGLLPKPRNS